MQKSDRELIINFVHSLTCRNVEILLCRLFYQVNVESDTVYYGKKKVKELRYRANLPIKGKRSRKNFSKATHKLPTGNDWRRLPRFTSDLRESSWLLSDFCFKHKNLEFRIVYKHKEVVVQLDDITISGKLPEAISRAILLYTLLTTPNVLELMKEIPEEE